MKATSLYCSPPSRKEVAAALSSAAAAAASPPPPLNAVPIRCDVVEYGKATALVVGATDAMRVGGFRRYLAGSDMVVWHDGGLSPVFAGATFAGLDVAATERHDLVLDKGSSHTVTTSCRNVRSRPLADPTAVVFVVNDASLPASAALSAADAAKHIVSGFRGGSVFAGARTTFGADANWARSTARLEELIRLRKANAFVVNVAATDGSKSVTSIEKQMVDVLSSSFQPKQADSAAYARAVSVKIDERLNKK